MTRPVPSRTLSAGLDRLASLGFLLADGADLQHHFGSDLLVALRRRPTLTHFDPEFVLAWTPIGGRGVQVRIDRTSTAGSRPLAWGVIRIFDRINAYNSFVTFGGTLTVEPGDDDSTILRFSSPAPILRWIGHSQGSDPRAADVESFFARIMVPIDFQPGAETRVSAAGPLALYAAMVTDRAGRLAAEPALRASSALLTQWVSHEAARLVADEPKAWSAGAELLHTLGLDPPAVNGTALNGTAASSRGR